MKIIIYNFDAINPLAHEWAHILADKRINVTLVNHRTSIECKSSGIKVEFLAEFKPSFRNHFDLIFLPWIPSRGHLLRFLFDWAKCGFPLIIWIDHNPVLGRDREGLILKILRYVRIKKICRVVHGTNSVDGDKPVEIYFPHPIFVNAFENSSYINRVKSEKQLNLAFIGRLDEQKGFFDIPRIAESISLKMEIPQNWIIAGNNPDLKAVQKVVDSLQEIPNVSVEAHAYGKKCPDEFIQIALLASHFLLAPYKQITASGTISLAIASGTEIISLSESVPIGLESFHRELIHCIDEDHLVDFIKLRMKQKSTKLQNTHSYRSKIQNYNKLCGENFVKILEIKKSEKYSNGK